jgi:hypothetical protein
MTKENNEIVISTDQIQYYSNGESISNFVLKKISDNLYELNNSRKRVVCAIKFRHLIHFENCILKEGNFIFKGNTKEMNLIIDEADLEYDKS